MVNNIISFDFDGTLNDQFNGDLNPQKKLTRDWVMRLKRRGYDVHIVTRRYGPLFSKEGAGNEHIEVLKLAKELGIDYDNVIFTNRQWKYKVLGGLGSIIHIDDDEKEKQLIERHLPNVKFIWVENKDWEQELVKSIESHDHIKIWLSSQNNVALLGIISGVILLTIAILNLF